MGFKELLDLLTNVVDGEIDNLDYFIRGCYMYLEKRQTGDLEVISEGLPNAEKLDLLIRKFAELLANGIITFDFIRDCFEMMEHLRDENGNFLEDEDGEFIEKERGMRDALIEKKDLIISLIPDTPYEEPEVEINNLVGFLTKLIGPELLSICRMKFMTTTYGKIEDPDIPKILSEIVRKINFHRAMMVFKFPEFRPGNPRIRISSLVEFLVGCSSSTFYELFGKVSFEDENLELVKSCCKPGVEGRDAFLEFLCDALQEDFENVCSTFHDIKRLDIEKRLRNNEIQIQSFFDIAG